MTRPATAHINLEAFRHNYRVAKACHGGKALAVIKANAYGHGAVRCAQSLAGEADGFAVACLDEALALRMAGIVEPILLLEGFFDASEIPDIVAHDLWLVVHSSWQLEMLLGANIKKPLNVWLKMDSGMHRLGLPPEAYAQAYQRLNGHRNVQSIVAMTHFANADHVDARHTLLQVETFEQSLVNVTRGVVLTSSLSNSAAILSQQGVRCDWARPGIMLYGANPITSSAQVPALQAMMTLTSKIIAIQAVKKGEAIGYGSIFKADRNMQVGVVAMGYADGYPRSAVTGTPVVVAGHITRLIGRVSMDMVFVDLTDIAHAPVGTPVELWGEQVSVNKVALSAGTIAYELFCNVKRVHFEYRDIAES